MSAIASAFSRCRDQGSLGLSEIHWYALYTTANHEKKVAEELNRRSIEVFLPQYLSLRHWKDRSVRLELPFFPGYVFVHFALNERFRVLQVPGVVRLVGFSNSPVPVPEIDIARLRSVSNLRFRIEPHPYLTAGRRVKVKAGPLTGLEGVVVRRKNNPRLVVSIELIKRSMAVELDEADLKED